MTIAELLILLLVAGLCGALGQAIAGGSRGGCLVSVAVGFVGATLGIWLARMLALPALFSVSVGGTSFPVVWGILGSAIFVALIHAVVRPAW
jgi:uncharacterized membrane protein YeaQ/YmgE (transglycosylase-associated protein family)